MRSTTGEPSVVDRVAGALRRRSRADVLVLATYGSAFMGLLGTPIVARSLGPSDRGLTGGLAAAAGLTILIGNLGIDSALLRQRVERSLPVPQINGIAAKYALTAGPVAAALLVGTCVLIAGDRWDAAFPGVVALAVLVPMGFWGNWCYKAALVDGHIRAQAVHRAAILGGPSLVGAVLALAGVLTPATYLFAFVACNAFGIAALTLANSGGFDWSAPVSVHVPFGARASAGALATNATQRLDQVLLVPLAGAGAAGLYVVAVSLTALPLAAAAAVGSRGVAALARADRATRMDAVTRYVRLAITTTLVLAIALAAVVAPLVPLVFGREYGGSVAPLLLLLPGIVVWSAGLHFHDVFAAIGRPGAFSVVEFGGMALSVVGLVALAPRYGAAGAAAVSSVTYILTRCAHIRMLRAAGLGSVVPTWDDVVFVLRRQQQLLRRGLGAARGARAR